MRFLASTSSRPALFLAIQHYPCVLEGRNVSEKNRYNNKTQFCMYIFYKNRLNLLIWILYQARAFELRNRDFRKRIDRRARVEEVINHLRNLNNIHHTHPSICYSAQPQRATTHMCEYITITMMMMMMMTMKFLLFRTQEVENTSISPKIYLFQWRNYAGMEVWCAKDRNLSETNNQHVRVSNEFKVMLLMIFYLSDFPLLCALPYGVRFPCLASSPRPRRQQTPNPLRLSARWRRSFIVIGENFAVNSAGCLPPKNPSIATLTPNSLLHLIRQSPQPPHSLILLL